MHRSLQQHQHVGQLSGRLRLRITPSSNRAPSLLDCSHLQPAPVCTTSNWGVKKLKINIHLPKARVEHNPRASHVVFGGGEEAVFSQGHIADERQYEHGDAQDNQAQGLGGADHFGERLHSPACVRLRRGVGLCCHRPHHALPSAEIRRRHTGAHRLTRSDEKGRLLVGLVAGCMAEMLLLGPLSFPRPAFVPCPPPAAAAASFPGSRFNQGDGAYMRVNASSRQ